MGKHALKSIDRAEKLAVKHEACSIEGRRHKLAHVFELQAGDEAALPPGVRLAFQPAWFSNKEWSSYDDAAVETHRRLVARNAICYGSDWDISSLSPLGGIADALRRLGTFSGSWSECLAQAIRSQTLEAARAMWLDSISGTLEVGKLADLCILDRNIFEDNAECGVQSDWQIAAELG